MATAVAAGTVVVCFAMLLCIAGNAPLAGAAIRISALAVRYSGCTVKAGSPNM